MEIRVRQESVAQNIFTVAEAGRVSDAAGTEREIGRGEEPATEIELLGMNGFAEAPATPSSVAHTGVVVPYKELPLLTA